MLAKHLPYEVSLKANRFLFYENHWKRVGLQLLRRHCDARGQAVLDYGCGRGEALQFFNTAGFRTTGTDIDPICVQLSSRFGTPCLLNPHAAFFSLGELAQIARGSVVLAVPNTRILHRIFHPRIRRDYVNEGHLQAWDHWHLLNGRRHCGLQLVEWGFDATILAGLSNLLQTLFGSRLTIKLETGVFKQLFPLHGVSVLELFRVSG